LTFFGLYLIFHLVLRYTFFPNYRLRPLCLYSYRVYFTLCIGAALCSLLMFAWALVSVRDFVRIREMVASRALSFRVGVSFPLVASLLFYMKTMNIRKGQRLVSALLIALAGISSSKIFIVMAMLYLIPWYKKGFKASARLLLFAAAAGVASFAAAHMSRGLISAKSARTLLEIALRQINGYLLGGFAAFQTYLDGRMITMDGGWVRTGEWVGNVYSAFYSLFHERAYGYFFARIMFISLLYAIIFVSKGIGFRFLKVYAVFPLLFIFFSDWFFSAMWVSFGGAALGISFIGETGERKDENALCAHNGF
jgi:hypothetical protein